MNEKTAKRIRKIARGLAVAVDQKGEALPYRRLVYLSGRSGTIINDPRTYRGIVLRLKKDFKGGGATRSLPKQPAAVL